MQPHDDRQTAREIRDRILASSQSRQEVKIKKLHDSTIGYHFEKILYYSRHGMLWSRGGSGQKNVREPTPHPPSLVLFRKLVSEASKASDNPPRSKSLRLITEGAHRGWLTTSWSELAGLTGLTTDKLKSALRFLEDGGIIKRHSPSEINPGGKYRRQLFMWIDVDRILHLNVEVSEYLRDRKKPGPKSPPRTPRRTGPGQKNVREVLTLDPSQGQKSALADELTSGEPVRNGVEKPTQTGMETTGFHGVRAPYLLYLYNHFGMLPCPFQKIAPNELTCSITFNSFGLPGQKEDLAAGAAVSFEIKNTEAGQSIPLPVITIHAGYLNSEARESKEDGQNRPIIITPEVSTFLQIPIDPYSDLPSNPPGPTVVGSDDFLNFPDTRTVDMAIRLRTLFSDCPETFDDQFMIKVKQAVSCQQASTRLTPEALANYQNQRAIHHSGDIPFIFRIDRATVFMENWRQIARTVSFLVNREATEHAFGQLVAADDFNRRRTEELVYAAEVGIDKLKEYPAITDDERDYFELLVVVYRGLLESFMATAPVKTEEIIRGAMRFVANSYLDLRYLEVCHPQLVPLLFSEATHRERLHLEYRQDIRICEIVVGSNVLEKPTDLRG